MPTERLETAVPVGAGPSLGRRAALHASLADPHRLAIVDELAVSDRSPSDLGGRLRMNSNLLAHHVDVLERAGLVRRVGSSGDGRRKYLQLVPDAVSELSRPADVLTARTILFVCTENAARSQFGAALWNARHEVPAESAGTEPAEHVHPEAIRAARRAGLDLTGARPRSLDEVTSTPDVLITVCDRALERLRPTASDTHLHWSVPDPSGGDPSVFDEALGVLVQRVETLAPRVHAVNVTASHGRDGRSHG